MEKGSQCVGMKECSSDTVAMPPIVDASSAVHWRPPSPNPPPPPPPPPSMASYKNLTAKAKTAILLYHAVPDYFSLQLLKSNNGMVTTLATASESKKDYSYDVQNKGETVTLDTRVVNSAVTATVGDAEPLAVYAVTKFLKPKELYKVVEAPAPAPEPSKKHKSAADDSSDDSSDDSGDVKAHKGAAAPAPLARWVTAAAAAAVAALMLMA